MDKKISELDEVTSLLANDFLPLARSGDNFRIKTPNLFKNTGIIIQTTSVGYIPGTTGNPDKNKVAPASNGLWYLFDLNGDAIKILDLLTGLTLVNDKHYTHTQGTPSSTWSVSHGLGKFPAIQVEDSAGQMVPIVQISQTDINNCVVLLAFPSSGKAYCN